MVPLEAARRELPTAVCTVIDPHLSMYASYSRREGLFSGTCFVGSRTHTVSGRMEAARLFSELPRRVLLGNWASGIPPSRKPSFVLRSAARTARSVGYTGPSSQGDGC